DGHAVFSSLPHPKDAKSDAQALHHAVGSLWAAGVEIDWNAYQAGRHHRRIPLPTYPFDRQRHWIDFEALERAGAPATAATAAQSAAAPALNVAPPPAIAKPAASA